MDSLRIDKGVVGRVTASMLLDAVAKHGRVLLLLVVAAAAVD